MNTSDLIQPRHLNRRAAIYIRQSSPQQVINNQESLKLQYALRDRALGLGWSTGSIEVIDKDLGRSGASDNGRQGFQELIAAISMGEIGVLIAYDATRLARNCTHWYRLLDLCGLHDCLLADRDSVYDPTSINGRLLLGLKGQISELELHTLRARLHAGLHNKAKRGELEVTLPVGLVRVGKQVMITPDQELADRIHLVFQTFLEQQSLPKTVRWFQQRGLKLPTQTRQRELRWVPAQMGRVQCLIKNPAYAGAIAYGRTTQRKSEKTGRMKLVKLPQDQWRYCLRDRFTGYIDWETFQRIQTMLHNNYQSYRQDSRRGVPREGQALLHGLMYCGRCGHKLEVEYHKSPVYVCNALRRQQRAKTCQQMASAAIDDLVIGWFFEALSTAEIQAAAGILETADREYHQTLSAFEQHVARAQYQAQVAERQYLQTDPDNRLVAGNLERRWEECLRELQNAQEQLARAQEQPPQYAIPCDLLEQLADFGRHLPELWSSGLLRSSHKKRLLRAMIDKVVVERTASDQVQVRVVWIGGAYSERTLSMRVGCFSRLSRAGEMETRIRELFVAGLKDPEIAERLTAEGFRSPLREHVLPKTVFSIRLRLRLLHETNQFQSPHIPGFLTVPQLSEKLGVSQNKIRARIQKKQISAITHSKTKVYLFPDNETTLAELKMKLTSKVQHSPTHGGHQDA